ncbi:MAG: SusD/RagB family nutrient-binding outer membrane lipoprotein [Flavisolibacter sp.]|jgi:hypothetical protein|nr:SusD/RagB family nutrient-binding outer membrane lipoprotein [Flavisolibacter sp.]
MKKILIKAGIVFLVCFTGSSCSKKIDDAYLNPNADVRVEPEKLLPQIISAMAGNYAGHGTSWDTRYVGAYIQNFSFYLTNSNFDRMGYTNNVADVAQSTWRMHYFDIGQNNQRMMQWAAEDEKWEYVGAGKAIEAWSWLILTDYYDNVILKEAFNTSKITFSYDKQPEVYEHVKKLCREALDNFNKVSGGTSASLAQGDAYFLNGDINKWKKFTNGILARVHNRYSNKSTYNADSVIHFANLAIMDNADNAMVKFEATNLSATNNFFGPLRNNLNATGVTSPTAVRQGEYIVNLLKGSNSAFFDVQDPRAAYMLRLNTNGTFVGVPPVRGQAVLPVADRPENFHGVSQNPSASNLTGGGVGINPRYVFRNNAPFPIMTAAEMHFLKAEAAFKKNDKGTALTAYREGIRQNFNMLMSPEWNVNIPAGMEITPAIRDAFLTDPDVVPASANNLKLSMIMLQKYISLFVYGALETWVDMRRYHYIDADPSGTGQVYADFMPPTGSDLFQDNNGELIYRYYPRFNSEYVWNIKELQRIGATALNYHANSVEKIWFALP